MSITPNIQDTISQFKSSLSTAGNNISGADVKSKLQSTISGISSKVDVGKIQSATDKLVTKDLMASTTKLGSSLDESIGGFQPLTKTVDDVVPKLEELSKPIQNTAKLLANNIDDVKDIAGKIPIAQMTSDVANMQDRLVRDLESDDTKSKLEAITGKASLAAKELMDVVVIAPVPEAITRALDEVATDPALDIKISVDEMTTILKENIDVELPFGEAVTSGMAALSVVDDIAEELGSLLDDILTDIVGTNLLSSVQGLKLPSLGDFGVSAIADNFKDLANGEVAKALGPIQNGFGSVMENAVETGFAPAAGSLRAISSIGDVKTEIGQSDLKSIIELKTAGDLDGAVRVAQKYSDASPDVIADTVNSIDNRSSTATSSSTSGAAVPIKGIKSWASNWRENPNSSPTFLLEYPTLNTKSAIVADLRSCQRDITLSFVTCTETGNDITYDAVEQHIQYYGDFDIGIPWNYVIRKDGKIEKGRPLDTKVPSKPTVIDEDARAWINASISISMVGGIDAPQDTPNLERYAGKKGYSEAQWAAFYKLASALIEVFPGISITGWDKAARPYFNVPDVIRSKFNRSNPLSEDEILFTNPPPTSSQISKSTGPNNG